MELHLFMRLRRFRMWYSWFRVVLDADFQPLAKKGWKGMLAFALRVPGKTVGATGKRQCLYCDCRTMSPANSKLYRVGMELEFLWLAGSVQLRRD